MRDEMRLCECGNEHPWGILRYSEDRVPLYGPRAIPTCDNYRPPAYSGRQLTADQLPAFVATAQELWAETGDLDPQATLATRVAVARIRSLAKGENSYKAMALQWPDFMGFIISQITEMRGALVRDESKFAHLVAHTDEVVEAMRDVVGLKEQLGRLSSAIADVANMVDELREERNANYSAEVEALQHFGLLGFRSDEEVRTQRDALFKDLFTRSLTTEPILTEAEPTKDG
jgi:hypothetical protein